MIGAQRVLLLHHHGDVEGARGLVANLNVGVEERHVAEPLAERDTLTNDAEHGVCACAMCAQGGVSAIVVGRCCRSAHLAVPPPPLLKCLEEESSSWLYSY